MQRSNPAAEGVRPDHFEGEPGLGETKNLGGGDCELRVVGIDVALIASTDQRLLANLAECWWVILLNPAPPPPPFFPPLLRGAVRVRPLGPRDPGDTTSNGAALLDPRGEVMAKKCRTVVHPGEAITEVREESHARHGVQSEIQKAKTVGVHDVFEEIREGRTEPEGEITDGEGVPIRGRPDAG